MNVAITSAPLAAGPASSRMAIADCDIHPTPNAFQDIYPYLEPRWHTHLETFGAARRHGCLTGSAYPKSTPGATRRDAAPPNGAKPGGDLDFMRAQHLDPNNVQLGILNMISPHPGGFVDPKCQALNGIKVLRAPAVEIPARLNSAGAAPGGPRRALRTKAGPVRQPTLTPHQHATCARKCPERRWRVGWMSRQQSPSDAERLSGHLPPTWNRVGTRIWKPSVRRAALQLPDRIGLSEEHAGGHPCCSSCCHTRFPDACPAVQAEMSEKRRRMDVAVGNRHPAGRRPGGQWRGCYGDVHGMVSIRRG